ncbi:glycosyltransferase family 2 protein [Ancylomarina sp. 16SWW S1-10-2]|uniref:glycosyltransferase family 2 protein n=1 Tax=Ancylomarina sp. 16SWW S1-10-2 TaxID=2499681 RepID=UPI00189E7F80|nr:glycosyltransferase family 2 protein [Ancylomarina sp. 16SWW S1-10-2]
MKISLLIPVYNAGDLLHKCLKSILNQDIGFEYEIVLVDDGSTDKSVEIIRAYQLEYSNVVLVQQKNSGSAAARNTALKYAKGEYLWFIDQDDFIDSLVLSKIYKILNAHSPDVVLMGWKHVTSDGEIKSHTKYKNGITDGTSLMKRGIFPNQLWNKLISSKLMKRNSLLFKDDTLMADDFHMSFRVMFYAQEIIMTDFYAYNWLYNPISISNKRGHKHLENIAIDSLSVGSDLERFIQNNNNDYKKIQFQKWLNNFWFGLFFSLYRFEYDLEFIKRIIREMKSQGIYPVSRSGLTCKRSLFTTIVNSKLFFAICKVNRVVKHLCSI